MGNTDQGTGYRFTNNVQKGWTLPTLANFVSSHLCEDVEEDEERLCTCWWTELKELS